MALLDDLGTEVKAIFATRWQVRAGGVVPEPESVKLGNDAVELDAAVLYADLVESTALVGTKDPKFAAEVFKGFLHCATKLIRSEGGVITSYDGDRVMGVFMGGGPETWAARCALKLNWVVRNILQPALEAQYSGTSYQVRHVVGVDSGSLLVARTGIRGSNDLVWVGTAANRAAKLSALREGGFTSWITERVYKKISSDVRLGSGKSMWEARSWNGNSIYRSNWTWRV